MTTPDPLPPEPAVVPERPWLGERPSAADARLADVADAATPSGNGDFATLRQLIVGPEQRRLTELAARVQELRLDSSVIAEHLPEAIALRSARDRQLGRALAPTIEGALSESVRRNPREIAAAIFPVLGPAIRKAIAEAMSGLVRSINRAVEHSLSLQGLRWRLESWRTGVPFAQIVIQRSLVYRVEQVFLIHADTGLLLQHVATPDLDAPNADLISSMLTAIQDFVRDSFRPNENATLRTFTVGEHTVHLEVGPRALLAAVVRGEAPPALTQRLQSTLELVHLRWAQQLTAFQGDAAPFAPAQPFLAECLETVLAGTGSSARGRWTWLRWAVPVALFALLAAGLLFRSRARFQSAMRALDDEPGIVLVDASREWGTWRVVGMRDPLARDPAVVLADAGFEPSALVARWDPYLALDSGIVVARAHRSLGAPPTVNLALRGDTLGLSGSAPLDWLARVRTAPLPAGTQFLDAAALQLTLPARLDSLRAGIDSVLTLFDAGSSELTLVAGAQLRRLARGFTALNGGVTTLGGAARLELTGRTDTTGVDAANRSLAQQRVDVTMRALASLGIPAELLLARAIATDSPLVVTDPSRRARANRSVAFRTLWGASLPRSTQ